MDATEMRKTTERIGAASLNQSENHFELLHYNLASAAIKKQGERANVVYYIALHYSLVVSLSINQSRKHTNRCHPPLSSTDEKRARALHFSRM